MDKITKATRQYTTQDGWQVQEEVVLAGRPEATFYGTSTSIQPYQEPSIRSVQQSSAAPRFGIGQIAGFLLFVVTLMALIRTLGDLDRTRAVLDGYRQGVEAVR